MASTSRPLPAGSFSTSNSASNTGAIDRLIGTLGRLPGIGAKTAERLAHHILKCPQDEALGLADAIRDVRQQVGLLLGLLSI